GSVVSEPERGLLRPDDLVAEPREPRGRHQAQRNPMTRDRCRRCLRIWKRDFGGQAGEPMSPTWHAGYQSRHPPNVIFYPHESSRVGIALNDSVMRRSPWFGGTACIR